MELVDFANTYGNTIISIIQSVVRSTMPTWVIAANNATVNAVGANWTITEHSGPNLKEWKKE